MVYRNPLKPPPGSDEYIEEQILAQVLAYNLEPAEDDYSYGYQLLQQEDPEFPNIFAQKDLALKSWDDDDDIFYTRETKEKPLKKEPIVRANTPSCDNPIPPIVYPPEIATKDIWTGEPLGNSQSGAESDSSLSDLEMDSEKVEVVKQVMVNITLPPSSIPDWAADVPEEQWKEYLFNKLHIKQKKRK